MNVDLNTDLILERKQMSELNAAPYNPRQITDKQVERLKNSITEFSLVEPIIWNRQTGNIVGGHQRYKVLQSLGIQSTQVVVVDIPISKEKALNLALNRIHGDWDLEMLRDVIIDIDTVEFPIELTGFDYDELKDLIDYDRQTILTDAEDDAIPEPPEKAITELGDTWVLGSHRLYCGDSTDEGLLKAFLDRAGSIRRLWLRPDRLREDRPQGAACRTGSDLLRCHRHPLGKLHGKESGACSCRKEMTPNPKRRRSAR